MDVTVIHLMTTLMERQLDAEAGAMLKASLVERGLKFEMGASTAAISGRDCRVAAVKLTDGRETRAGPVACPTASSPTPEWRKRAV